MDADAYITIASVVLFVVSEVIGLSKLKDNSVVQLILTILTKAFPYKKGM